MIQSVKRMGLLIQRKRKSQAKDDTILAKCPECDKQKPTYKMYKSPVNRKHYCTKLCCEKADCGEKEVDRMRDLAGLDKIKR